MSSDTYVFAIQNERTWTSSNTKSMPVPSGSSSLYMRPWALSSGVRAISAKIVSVPKMTHARFCGGTGTSTVDPSLSGTV